MRIANPGAGGWTARLALLLTLAGCASGTGGGQDPSMVSIVTPDGAPWEIRRSQDLQLNRAVAASPDETWAALSEVFAAIGLQPDIRDSGRRRLGVSGHRFSGRILNRTASDFFDCGSDPGLNRPLADQVPITAQVMTDVLAVGATAELHTVVQGTARRTGGNAGVAACRSTGLLETVIGEMVQKVAVTGG
ncbi:MAG TPA: hypothetical protein VGA70_10050 [Longimicrobiales bacterium]|jgi:hypothetical protein